MAAFGKILKFCSKSFMTTPIHVLRSNFTEIVHWEVGETMCCFADKMFAKCVFSGLFAPVWQRHQTFARQHAT